MTIFWNIFFHRAAIRSARSFWFLPDSNALINYDRENKTELYRTLQVYLEHERNSLQTAKTLFIHRSSLVYRLERIQKITRIDLDNPRNRLLLQICFLLIQEKEPASD